MIYFRRRAPHICNVVVYGGQQPFPNAIDWCVTGVSYLLMPFENLTFGCGLWVVGPRCLLLCDLTLLVPFANVQALRCINRTRDLLVLQMFQRLHDSTLFSNITFVAIWSTKMVRSHIQDQAWELRHTLQRKWRSLPCIVKLPRACCYGCRMTFGCNDKPRKSADRLLKANDNNKTQLGHRC